MEKKNLLAWLNLGEWGRPFIHSFTILRLTNVKNLAFVPHPPPPPAPTPPTNQLNYIIEKFPDFPLNSYPFVVRFNPKNSGL